MNLEKELINISKKIKGRLVCFDVNNTNVLDAIEKNKKIDGLYEFSFSNKISKKMKYKLKRKRYNIKKIKKYFKKKSIDYFMGDITNLKKYFNTFIKNSINLNNNTIYLYGKNSDYDLNELIYRYKRYGIKVTVKNNEEYFVLEIIVLDIKTKFLKNCQYQVRDNMYNIGEYISQVLIN